MRLYFIDDLCLFGCQFDWIKLLSVIKLLNELLGGNLYL